MSSEGYFHALCKTGHLTRWDVYDDEPTKCSICGKPFVWRELVDTTNGEGRPTKLKLVGETSCGLCHTVLEQRYEIPKKKRRGK